MSLWQSVLTISTWKWLGTQILKQHFTKNDSQPSDGMSASQAWYRNESVRLYKSGHSYQFTPTVSFFSPEFQSEYVKGLRYTVRPGNDRLHCTVQQLVSAGTIAILSHTPKGTQPSKLSGKGVVR